MDENVAATAVRLNEAIAFRWIEPLYNSGTSQIDFCGELVVTS
jgi:hypothetical protein